MSSGVVYVAAGPDYVEEAVTSAESLRRQMPGVPVTLYTDRSVDATVFDDVEVLSHFQHTVGDSILRPSMIPYERNLFLDTDTYVAAPIDDVFEVLDRFDLAVTHSPGRLDVEGTPDCVPEYNTGVVGYANTDTVAQMFDSWVCEYEEQVEAGGGFRNQASFTRCLYRSDIEYVTLPREYNVRVPRLGYVNGAVRVVHGRHRAGLGRLAAHLNRSRKARVFYMDQYVIGAPLKLVEYPPIPYRIHDLAVKTVASLKRDGIRPTAKKAFDRLPFGSAERS